MATQILLVDDDPDLRMVLGHLLRKAGHDVIEAGTTGEALASVVHLKPRLVILDLDIPGGGGLAVLRGLRELAVAIPVLVMTGASDGPDVRLALALGAARCLTKPFVTCELITAVALLEERAEA